MKIEELIDDNQNVSRRIIDTVTESSEHLSRSIISFFEPNNFIIDETNLGLTSDIEDPFVIWKLFYDDCVRDRDNVIMNVCSISLGALVLINSEDADIKLTEKQQQLINKSINSLILLVDENGSWPSSWEMGRKTKNSGNINQTTLSLSVLLRCGFFEYFYLSNKPLDSATQKNRYSFLIRSLKWLLNNKVSVGEFTGWYYSRYSDDNKIAVMSTSYVFSTFNKVSDLLHLHEETVNSIDNNIIEQIDKSIVEIENFFARKQNRDGGYSRSYSSSNKRESTTIHTCFALNVLCKSELADNAVRIRKAVKYLQSQKTLISGLKISVDDLFDVFNYNETQYSIQSGNEIIVNRVEKHENYPYSNFIITFTDILSYYNSHPSVLSKTEIHWIKHCIHNFWMQIKENQIEDLNGYLVVKGFRIDQGTQFPIYILYNVLLSSISICRNPKNVLIGYNKKHLRYAALISLAFLFAIGLFLFTKELTYSLLMIAITFLYQLLRTKK